MQAAISGLQGIAILIDDSKLNLIDISNPSVVNACSNSFASNFLSRSVDCVFVDNISIESVAKHLEASWEGHAVIRLVSIINDATADDELLADAVEELNEIATTSPDAVEFAERYLFSAQTQIELSRLSDKTPEAVRAILTKIQSVQPAITSVLQAIERSLASELQDSTERARALATLIREGVVRRFVLAVHQTSSLDDVLAFASTLPSIGQIMSPVLIVILANLQVIAAPLIPNTSTSQTGIALSQAEEHVRILHERLELSTAEIGLSVRTTNCLEERGIFTVRDLLRSTPKELLSISNFGEKTLQEVYIALEKIGYTRPNLRAVGTLSD